LNVGWDFKTIRYWGSLFVIFDEPDCRQAGNEEKLSLERDEPGLCERKILYALRPTMQAVISGV